MSMTPEEATWFAGTFARIVANVGVKVRGKEEVIRLVFAAMLAEGHILLEDAPGTGKTSLAKALGDTVDGTMKRIQFTPDLLPSDVTGVSIWNDKKRAFEFQKGPIFATVVLADEINRASPKTQSALLEVMEESRVTVDGVTHDAGRPFLVIATQNPIEQAGTYKLPEAQLDRFMIKTAIGYPDLATTGEILDGVAERPEVKALITPKAIGEMADLAAKVHVDSALSRYVAQLTEETRTANETRIGVSVRGALAIIRLAKVWAAAQGRHYVTPDDIKELAGPAWTHRLVLDAEAEFGGVTAASVVARVLADIAAPQARVSVA